MEMCYDGALVMPSNYVVVDEDEMMYVEGGKTYTGHFASVGQARHYMLTAATNYRIIGTMEAFSGAAAIAALGCVGGIAGAVVGALIGSGIALQSSRILSWSSTYYSIADDLKKYKQSKRCDVTFTTRGATLTYSIKVK